MNFSDDDDFNLFVLTQSELLLPHEILWCLQKVGLARDVLMSPKSLWQEAGLSEKRIPRILAMRDQLSDWQTRFEGLQKHNIQLLSYRSTDFPDMLKHTASCPLMLFYRGKRPDFTVPKFLAVVGTRHATEYAKQILTTWIPQLCAAGLVIVSGLAFGVDSWAHEKSAEYPGQSLAVLAKGVEQASPRAQHALFARLCDTGCVLSEFAFSQDLHARHFPRRNRIVSGLSSGVLVVEAPKKSGALITAHFALEQNRQVYAVPGNVWQKQSEGCLGLIQQGAKLVTSAADILEDYAMTEQPAPAVFTEFADGLNAFAKAVLDYCAALPRHKEEIFLQFADNASQVSATLTQLQLQGLIVEVDGKFMQHHFD